MKSRIKELLFPLKQLHDYKAKKYALEFQKKEVALFELNLKQSRK